MNIVIKNSENRDKKCERRVTYAEVLAKNINVNNDKNMERDRHTERHSITSLIKTIQY